MTGTPMGRVPVIFNKNFRSAQEAGEEKKILVTLGIAL